MSFDPPKKASLSERAGFVLRPGNLARTIASHIPFTSGVLEISSQLANMEVDRRLGSLEQEVRVKQETTRGESQVIAGAETQDALFGWPMAIPSFANRIVTIAIAYDGGFHTPAKQSRELLQPVAQGCMIDRTRFITCREALELANDVCDVKAGRLVIVVGMAMHSLTFDDPLSGTGLVTGNVGDRDEAKWEKVKSIGLAEGIDDLEDQIPNGLVPYSIRPRIGEECGFLYPGEASDVMYLNGRYERTQFDKFTISHFRRPTENLLISFVSGVLPGRILQCGSPIFNCQGKLLGILSDTESYEGDAGRRAVVLGLMGHPAFPVPLVS